MVNARLHIICGNCGSNSDFKWKYIKEDALSNGDIMTAEDVHIYCENCGTIHDISSNATRRDK